MAVAVNRSPMPADANELAASVYPVAVRYAFKRARGNDALAEVLVSAAGDAVLRALRKWEPGRGPFKPFCWFVVKGELSVTARRFKARCDRRPTMNPITDAFAACHPAPPSHSAAGFLAAELKDLPGDQAAAVRFYYVDGHDLEDCGLLLGCGKDHVRGLLQAAARTLAPDLDAPDRAKGARCLER